MQRGEVRLQRVGLQQLPGLQVGHQYVPALELPAPADVGVLLKQHARLAGQYQPPVVGQRAAQGPQAVAVQRRAHAVAVGIEYRGGAVPGLHHGGVIAVEVAPGPDFLLSLPRLGQQHHARQRQREAVHRQKFQRVVQHLGVAAVRVHHGQHALHGIAHHGGAHGLLAGLHAVVVAADGVDLAVVQKHPLRVRLRPAREGVGGEAGVYHGHLRDVAHILKIVVERAELADQHHALVHDGAGRQRADVGVGVLLFEHAAQHVQLAVEVGAGVDAGGALQEALADAGHGAPRARAQLGRVAGHVAPAQHRDALGGGQPVEYAADVLNAHLVLGQKEHPDAIVAGLAEVDAFLPRPCGEEFVGEPGHDAHAVAGGAQRVGARPVGQALHDGQRLVHGAVGRPAAQIGNRAHAAGFVLQFGVIERVLLVVHFATSLLRSG